MNRHQQTARVNVSDEEWIEFRTLAMRQRQSVAEYLGELIRAELAAAGRASSTLRHGSRRARTDKRAPAPRPASTSVRLSDQRLLTELPRPDPRPREP